MENSNAAARKKQHIRADSSRLSEKSGRQSRNGPTRSAGKPGDGRDMRTSRSSGKKGSRAAPSGTGARVSSRDNGRGAPSRAGKERKAPSEKKKNSSRRAQPAAERREKKRAPKKERKDGIFVLLIYVFFRRFQKRYGGFAAGCICIFSFYFLIAAVFVGAHAMLFFGNTVSREDVAYLYTDGSETEKHPAKEQTLSYESVFRKSKEPYINFTDLAEKMNLITVGSNRQLRFSLPDEPESSALFTGDSCGVVVNGCNAVVMSSPARIVGRTVYIPLSFLQNYTVGFSAAYDAKENRITVDRLVDEAATTDAELAHIRFRYSIGSTKALEPISGEEIHS